MMTLWIARKLIVPVRIALGVDSACLSDPLPKLTHYRHSSMNPGTAMECIDCRHNVF
ncbi:MAG TPA: hypothetical protein PK236_01900 [Verrucomicrobiota bacterium]|jgi:hypothetical protein|nr:hypothetical protein [Verrucomicrobiota bacterium]